MLRSRVVRSMWIGMLLLSLAPGAAGCRRQAAVKKEAPPPEVTVALPVQESVTEQRDYVGHIGAVRTVEIRARVRGFLERIHFKEGQEVAKGELLYEIDPRTFQAEVDKAKADVGRLQALAEQARSEAERAKRLLAKRALAEEEFVQRSAAAKSAEAAVAQAQATLESVQLELEFTRIHAPIAGRIGRTLVNEGNLVGFTEPTLLTTIVQVHPVFVYFPAPERDFLEYQRMLKEDPTLPTAAMATVPVQVSVGKEAGFPHEGILDFRDNKIDAGTGTIQLRAELPNERRILTPGLFARVRVPFGKPRPHLLVPETALQADMRGRYVFTLKPDDTVEHRPVTAGPTIDGLVLIRDGLWADDRVIVNGVQRARPGGRVTPTMSKTREAHP